MEKEQIEERTLNIRDVTKEFLTINHWSISDLSDIINVSRSTISEWLGGKRELNTYNLMKIKAFLAGKYFCDIETLINSMLIMEDLQNDG